MWAKAGMWMCVAVGAVAAMGCDRAASPSGALSGVWTGAVTDTTRGSGTMRLVLEQDGLAVGGTLQTTFHGVVERDGAVAGTVIGAGTSATISHATGRTTACPNGQAVSDTITLTVAMSGGRLGGSYLGFTCSGLSGGAFDLSLGS